MTEIMIYGEIGDSFAGLDATTVIEKIGAGNDAIDVRINSGGGYIVEGLAIFNALMRAKDNGRKVTVYIDGLAASMASVIACAGDTIMMAENALIMIHNPWDGMYGDANDLRKMADRLDLLRDQIVDIYTKRTGLDPDALRAMMDAETWFDAETALASNFITGIVVATYAAASIDLTKFGYRKVPVHLQAVALRPAGDPPAAAAVTPLKENAMDTPVTPAAPGLEAPVTIETVANSVETAVAAERGRIAGIRALAAKHNIDPAAVDAMCADGAVTVDKARAKVLDILAERGDAARIGHQPAIVTLDSRDKWLQGAMNNIILRAGVANDIRAAASLKGESIDLDPGEFRGVTMLQLATEALANAGDRPKSRAPEVIIGQALTARASGGANGTGDFSVLLENVMHKTLQSAYMITPDTWSRFCGIGSVTDFRAHPRYLVGSIGGLDDLTQHGEFKNKQISDGARESITATTKGNIISITRQALINDDLGAFTSLAMMFGRAAKLRIEQDVYALLVANPLMNDGIALFAAGHGNLGTAAAPTVASFDEARVLMGLQRDVSGNEVLDLKPSYWVGPIGLGGPARVVNGAQYDPTPGAATMRPNIVLGLFQDLVDTARLTGTTWYTFANKDTAPAIEVAFLNGQTEPYFETVESWRFDGTEMKVRHDWAVGAINWRSATRNAGA
jgi:ATP-dependent protease ClpP protease subunit